MAVNRLKQKHTRDESDQSYNQQKHLDKLAFQTQKSQKRARNKSMYDVSGYPKDNQDIADVATSQAIKHADVSKKQSISSNRIQEQQYAVEVEVVQKIRKGSTSGLKHRQKPYPQPQPSQLLLESHMIPIMPRKQKHFEPIKERTELTQTDDHDIQNFFLNDIHIVNAQTEQLLIDLLTTQMENKQDLTPFQNENIMTSYNRDSNQNVKVDAVEETYAERQRPRKETPENRNGIKRVRGKSVRKVNNDFQQQITSQECEINSFQFELQNKASMQAERFSQLNQFIQPKIVSHSITTQNIQRSKDDGNPLITQKQETFQSPTSLTKVIVAVTKDGYENQYFRPIAFNSPKLATVNEQHILDHQAQSLASHDFGQTSDRKPEIMLPKFSFEISDQRELFPLFQQKELSTNRNKKINDGGQRKRSKTGTNEQPNSDIMMSSFNTAENEFALIVRGINNLITNSPLNHDPPEDFKKILQKTKQQVKQDQISIHHSEENEKDFGVVGVQKDVFKKKTLKEQIAFRKQQKTQMKLKTIKALKLQAQDYFREQGNTTMRDDSICLTPGTKKANELIFMQAGQDNDSFLHNRNAVSALERATKDTILESEATSQIISFNRNGPKMNSSEENGTENFDRAKEISSLIITKNPVSPIDSQRQKTQTQQTFRKNNFKVEIENKPATKLEASFSFQVQNQNGNTHDQQVAAPDYTAILQQQHFFQQKKWLKSSQIGQRTRLTSMWNGDRGSSQMPNSFNTELIQRQSNYASYLGSKKNSQDFSNFNHSRFKSQPTELGFAKSNFNADKMMMVKTQEIQFDQKRITAHGKRHLYMEKRKQSQLQKHHKGLFNMAEIHSTKLTGIKISRLTKPQDLDPYHLRSISEMQPTLKPMKVANTSKIFQEIRAETKVQAEALIDFKCKGSMFNATQQKFVPLSNLVNLAVDLHKQDSSDHVQLKIIALRLDIEQQERVKSKNKIITQIQDPKEKVFNILFPKENQQAKQSRAIKKHKLDLNLQSDVQNLISQIGGNTDDPSRQNRMVFVTGQTNYTGHTEWIQGQIGTMVLEPDSAMIKIQIDDQDYQRKKSSMDSTNQLNKSSISQQRRQSIDRQPVSNQTNELLSRESKPDKVRRPALTSSINRSQAFNGTVNASPELNKEQEITPNSSPHDSSHDGEASQSEYRTQDSQQKLKPISKISITASNKKLIRQSQPIKIMSKSQFKDVQTTPVSQNATLQISIEELRPSRHRDVNNSQEVVQIMPPAIGITQVQIKRNQKSDVAMPEIKQANMNFGNFNVVKGQSGFVLGLVGERIIPNAIKESTEQQSQLKQKKRSTSTYDVRQLTTKKQQDQRYLEKKSTMPLQQMDANSVTNQEKKNVGSKQKLIKSSAGWDKDRLQTQTEEILSSRHREAISTTQRQEMTTQDNKDIEEVTGVTSPTSKQVFGVMVVSHRENKNEPVEEEKTHIFNKMLNQIGLQQLKPKIFEAQLSSQYTEGKHTESLDSQEQVINFDTVLLDTKGNFRDKDKGLIKGLSYKKRQNDSQEKVSSKSKSKLNNIIIKGKKFRQTDLFCLESLRRGDKVVKIQVKSIQLRQISNIMKVFKLQTEKDRLMYVPQIEDFCQMVESLQGYSYHQGVLDFVKDKSHQMPNRIPVNQFQDEYRLKQSQWFYHFEKSELENLCALLSIKHLNSASQNSDTHSNDDVDSITGETFSQNTLRRIHEDTSDKHYMVRFTSLHIINISCRSGLIADQSPLYLPFMYLPRLYFLSKHQLQLLLSNSLVLSQSKQGIKLELDLLKLENELKKIKPCKERDAFKSFSLKVMLFFENFDLQIPFDEFVVEVEMPMFEIVERVGMVSNGKNGNRLTGYVPEKNLQKYSRVLKHTLQVPDFAQVIQKEQLVDWHQTVKDLILNGTFGDQKTYMHQEYLMAEYPESFYPTFQSLDNNQKTLLLPPAIKLQISYIEPLQLELVAPIQNEAPEMTSQLRERIFQKYHQTFTDVIVATMEVPMAKLENVYQVFGNGLSSTEDDKTTFAGCASNLIHVYADPDQALLKLDLQDWDLLEDIQLLNVTRILSNPKTPVAFHDRSTLPKDQGVSVLGPKPVILKPKDFQQDHSKCCNSKNQDCTLGLNNQNQTKTKPTIMLNDKLECSLRVKPASIVSCVKIPMTDNLTVEHKVATSEGMMRFINDLNHHRSLQRI